MKKSTVIIIAVFAIAAFYVVYQWGTKKAYGQGALDFSNPGDYQ